MTGMHQDDHIDILLARLADGTLTDDELAVLVDWYNGLDDTQTVLPATHEDTAAQLKARMHKRLMNSIKVKPQRSVLARLIPYAAAILVAVLGIGYFLVDRPDLPAASAEAVHDIPPGRNRATLTLADGRAIDLSEAQDGIIIGNGITYTDGSKLVDNGELIMHSDRMPEKSLSTIHHQLSTPRGGTYQIILSDGTKVWLNAGSLLKYPGRFGGDARKVELIGEAYFDVHEQMNSATGEWQPFIVVADGQEIEVLGTEFNVSAYPDDTEFKTTLVTGSVRVVSNEESIVLQPHEQARVGADGIRVKTVKIEPFIAWKSGKFHFRRTPLEDVLKQVSRWYDVEVVYSGEAPKETFSGKIRRNVSLVGVLDILRLSAIDVTLVDRTLIVN